MLNKTTLFVVLNVKTMAEQKTADYAVNFSSFDPSSFSDDYLLIKTVEVEYELPENLVEMGTEALEKSLSKLRAEHHAKEQQLIDQIAGLRMLAAPKQGEVMDDRDLRQAAKSRFEGAEDAEDVDASDDCEPHHIPF